MLKWGIFGIGWGASAMQVNFVQGRYHLRWHVWAIAAASTLVLLPILCSSTFPKAPDAATHLLNCRLFGCEFGAGAWYPRWLGEWYGGFGAPIGVAYSPLTYLLTGSMIFLGVGTLSALKIVLWFSVFFSGYFMFVLSRRVIPLTGALVAGVFYMFSPYLVIDLYGRGALPETVAFVWLPLIFLFLFDTTSSGSWVPPLLLGLSFSLLILTHSMVAYLFTLSLIIPALLFLFAAKRNPALPILRLLLSSMFALGISAIYWLPALVESRFLNSEWFSGASGWGNYRNNFVFSAQIYKGTDLNTVYLANLTIGIVVLLFFVLCIFCVMKLFSQRNETATTRQYFHCAMIGTLLMSLFMSTRSSEFLWSLLPFSDIIAFPWRWLTVSSCAAAFLAGDVFWWLVIENRKPGEKISHLGILYCLFLTAIICYSVALEIVHRNQIKPEVMAEILGERPLPAELFQWVYDNPFLPIWSRDFDYTAASKGDRARFAVEEGTTVVLLHWDSVFRKFVVDSDKTSSVGVRTFWFPGWVVHVNRRQVRQAERDSRGLIFIDVEAGKSEIELRFEATPVRRIGEKVSKVASAAWAVLFLLTIVWEKRARDRDVSIA